MSYWSEKSDLAFIEQFHTDVEELWRLEGVHADMVQEWRRANFRSLEDPPEIEGHPDYQQARERVAQALAQATDIAVRHGVGVQIVNYPPPIIADRAPPISTSTFEIILRDRTYKPGSITREYIRDDINKTLGVVRQQVQVERRHVLNPAWWFWQAVTFILRIPFRLLEATGFDVAKIEDTLWARLFKALEVLAILYFAARWGFGATVSP